MKPAGQFNREGTGWAFDEDDAGVFFQVMLGIIGTGAFLAAAISLVMLLP